MASRDSKSAKNRISRICGQVEGLRRMIDEDRYCVDILTQIAAARSALDALGVSLLSEHIKHCVGRSPHAHPQSECRSDQDLTDEVEKVLHRFLK